MELADLLAEYEHQIEGHDELSGEEHAQLVINLEQLTSRLHALRASAISIASKVEAHRSCGSRTLSLHIARNCDISRNKAGRVVNNAKFLVTFLPAVHNALLQGTIHQDHADLLIRIASRKELTDAAMRDQGKFVQWAARSWIEFAHDLNSWAEVNDERDPQELAEKPWNDRSFTTAQGLGETIIDLRLPNTIWAELEAAMRPIEDRMYDADWTEVRESLGANATLNDMTRTTTQRRVDAFVEIMRQPPPSARFGAQRGKAVSERSERHHATFVRETNLMAGISVPTTFEDIKNYRSETDTGIPIPPRMAVQAAIANEMRRWVISPDGIDFESSKTVRIYRGLLRLGIVIRDQFCTEPGCDTRAHHCEIDHHKPWSMGGQSTPRNGRALCRPAHREKTAVENTGQRWPTD